MGKQKQKQNKNLPQGRPGGGMAMAANWPVHEVLVARGWEQPGALISILIARQSPNSGKVAATLLLVDLACLGIKSAQVKLFKHSDEYAAELRAHALRIQPMAPASFNLAAKIVFTGLEYAAALGFKPDPVFAQSELLLAGAQPEDEPTPVPTGGPEGKPLFVSGPYDNVERIVAQLRRTVGDGNFHFLLGGPGSAMSMKLLNSNFDLLPEPEER
jgi:hypothetical protein